VTGADGHAAGPAPLLTTLTSRKPRASLAVAGGARYPVRSVPTCLRCRRETPPPDEDDDLVLRLDGPPMLQALRELDRSGLDEDQLELVEALAAGLCPACGQEL
jgi:hypothetical protein